MEEETKKFDLSNRMFSLIAVFVAGILILFLAVVFYNFTSLPENAPEKLTVSGEGKAYVKPDIAVVTVGLKTEGQKSGDVVKENNQKMNAVIEAVKKLGVEDKDIQTSQYNLNPKYNYTKDRGSFLDGYELNQQVTIKIRNFDKISEILDQATSNGANTVGNLQFSVDDPEKARAEARQKAVDQAKAKAKDMAKSAGMSIKLINITESTSGYYPMAVEYKTNDMAYGMGSASSAPQIQSGQQEITVNVSLIYRIK